MKYLLILSIAILLTSCGSRETIKKRYLYSETVMQLLSDEEYYQLDKDSKWPNDQGNTCELINNINVLDR
jgi:uncharacterized lipoprotein YmbA|tara:strand:- start:365 stop:574 length:210 start_codon:yes stop_codon:yes gene_type:complete